MSFKRVPRPAGRIQKVDPVMGSSKVPLVVSIGPLIRGSTFSTLNPKPNTLNPKPKLGDLLSRSSRGFPLWLSLGGGGCRALEIFPL